MTNKGLLRNLILYIIGGLVYVLIEFCWRAIMGSNNTHWAMFFVGGTAFCLIGGINEGFSFDMSLLRQGVIGAVIVTIVEFMAGCVLNIWLGLGVWDYSQLPFNLMGQVCLQFTGAWFVLSCGAIILDDYLRYWLFGEEKPHYRLF